jgi:four helix bundle protein
MAGVTRFEDLDCWKLANELKVGVCALVNDSPARHDFDFRDQLRRSASSGPANIAEAFGYYRHPEGARHARIAKASLTETDNHLLDGVARGHWQNEQIAVLRVLARRAIGATIGWIRHLETSKTPEPSWAMDRVEPTRRRGRG